jgi:hypothetical protein
MTYILKFERRTNGTGTVLDTTFLGHNETSTGAPAMWSFQPDGMLIKCVVETFYFADPTQTNAQQRVAAVKYIEDLRSALLYRPIIVKELARGKAVMPRIVQNFGTLVLHSPSTTLLTNCTLIEASVSDDVGINGIGIRLVFGRVADAATP